jgi:hypothetical protein
VATAGARAPMDASDGPSAFMKLISSLISIHTLHTLQHVCSRTSITCPLLPLTTGIPHPLPPYPLHPRPPQHEGLRQWQKAEVVCVCEEGGGGSSCRPPPSGVHTLEGEGPHDKHNHVTGPLILCEEGKHFGRWIRARNSKRQLQHVRNVLSCLGLEIIKAGIGGEGE